MAPKKITTASREISTPDYPEGRNSPSPNMTEKITSDVQATPTKKDINSHKVNNTTLLYSKEDKGLFKVIVTFKKPNTEDIKLPPIVEVSRTFIKFDIYFSLIKKAGRFKWNIHLITRATSIMLH